MLCSIKAYKRTFSLLERDVDCKNSLVIFVQTRCIATIGSQIYFENLSDKMLRDWFTQALLLSLICFAIALVKKSIAY